MSTPATLAVSLGSGAPDRFELLAVPLVLLAAAAATDVNTRRIPDWITVLLLSAALAVAATRGGTGAVLEAVAGVGVGLLLYYLPFALGWMGAGDVKLLAASGAWLGPAGVVELALWSAVAGGVVSLAVVMMAPRSDRARVRANVSQLLRAGSAGLAAPLESSGTRRGVPYGVAIAVTAAVLLVTRT